MNGVSIRQIARAVGSANSSVVAYHFGDKSSLLKAVITHRLSSIDERRRALLHAVSGQTSDPDLRSLIDALYRPFFEQKNIMGKRSYAAFVAELVRANEIDVRTSLIADFPATQDILAQLRHRTGELSPLLFDQRIFLASALIFAALRQIDQICASDAENDGLFENAMDAAAAVIGHGI